MRRAFLSSRGWIASTLLLGIILATGAALAAWKYTDIAADEAAAANQPEPTEAVTAAAATERDYRPTTTSVGTVLALRSITLRNELAGTVAGWSSPPARSSRPAPARGARRLGRAGRAAGAGGAGGAGADHARPPRAS